MKTDKLKEKYIKYELTKEDVFKHQHYIIITRSGIEKIQAIEGIQIEYKVIKCEANFAAVKATAMKGDVYTQTFGSALKGNTFKDGNTNTWKNSDAVSTGMFNTYLLMGGTYFAAT